MLAAADFSYKIQRLGITKSVVVSGRGAHDDVNFTVLKSDHTGRCLRNHLKGELFGVGNIIKRAVIKTYEGYMVTGYDFIIHPRAGADFNGIHRIHGLKSFLGENCERVCCECIVEVNVTFYQFKFKVQVINFGKGFDLLCIRNSGRVLARSLHERKLNVISVKDRTVMELNAFLEFKGPVSRINHSPAFKKLAFILHCVQICVSEKVAGAVLNNLVGLGSRFHRVGLSEFIRHCNDNLFLVSLRRYLVGCINTDSSRGQHCECEENCQQLFHFGYLRLKIDFKCINK